MTITKEEARLRIVELGDPRLSRVARPVSCDDWNNLPEIIETMGTVMNLLGGVGIAAPQIGIDLQVLIVASKPTSRYPTAPDLAPLVMVNPMINELSERLVGVWEGCLSVPGIRGKVTRPEALAIDYLDCNKQCQQISLEGFPARVFLHEYDHLIGKTFVDRVSSIADLVTEKVYQDRILSS